MSNSIISVGDSYRLYGSEVVTHDDLPVGTYDVAFSPMSGYSLTKTYDLTAANEKVYGSRDKKIDKVFKAWGTLNRSLGVMLSGDKGQGKSLFLRMLADRAREEGMPVVRVTKSTPGLAEFIDTLGECVVLFDEFEKVFSRSKVGGPLSDDEASSGSQDQFLSIFDGMSQNNRIYCLTFNEIHNVSNYLLNRPGRFHYHIRFDYPNADEITTYLRDNVSEITDKQIDDVIAFSNRTGINYDHLRAIAFEFNVADEGAPLSDFLNDLNIKPVEAEAFRLTVHTEDGKVGTATRDLELQNDSGPTSAYLTMGNHSLRIVFDTADIDVIDNRMIIPGSNIIVDEDYLDDDFNPTVTHMELTLMGQRGYTY